MTDDPEGGDENGRADTLPVELGQVRAVKARKPRDRLQNGDLLLHVPIDLDGVTTVGGLVAGVVSTAVDALRDLGAGSPRAVLGPCIRPAHYEFGASDLDDYLRDAAAELDEGAGPRFAMLQRTS